MVGFFAFFYFLTFYLFSPRFLITSSRKRNQNSSLVQLSKPSPTSPSFSLSLSLSNGAEGELAGWLVLSFFRGMSKVVLKCQGSLFLLATSSKNSKIKATKTTMTTIGSLLDSIRSSKQQERRRKKTISMTNSYASCSFRLARVYK